MSAELWLEKQKQMKRFTVYKRGGGSRRDPSVVAETEERGACDLTPPHTHPVKQALRRDFPDRQWRWAAVENMWSWALLSGIN